MFITFLGEQGNDPGGLYKDYCEIEYNEHRRKLLGRVNGSFSIPIQGFSDLTGNKFKIN